MLSVNIFLSRHATSHLACPLTKLPGPRTLNKPNTSVRLHNTALNPGVGLKRLVRVVLHGWLAASRVGQGAELLLDHPGALLCWHAFSSFQAIFALPMLELVFPVCRPSLKRLCSSFPKVDTIAFKRFSVFLRPTCSRVRPSLTPTGPCKSSSQVVWRGLCRLFNRICAAGPGFHFLSKSCPFHGVPKQKSSPQSVVA